MAARPGKADRRYRAAAADASVALLEATTAQKFFGDATHFDEADGARKREAGIAQGFAGCIEQQALHSVGWCHPMLRDGEVTRARASELARMVMRDNAANLYGIK